MVRWWNNENNLSLAISRLKYNKGRSILTIVAIALMTTLLMSIGSSALTVIRHQQLEIKESARNYHAAFKGSTADQVFILENHADVESLSTRESVASIELPKLNAVLNFDSTKKGSIDQIQLANGKMPVEADEIAGPPALFERLDVVPEIGQKFQIPLRIQGGKVENYDFTITGILEQTDISKLNVNETRLVYGAFVSEKFVEQHIAPEDRTYTAYIRIVNENKHSKDEIETIISEIAEDVGLNKSDISFNEQYLTYMTNPGTQERNVMIGLGLLVVFLGGMVIYSIYYVSVISNIQEMGKLKALGATKNIFAACYLQKALHSLSSEFPVESYLDTSQPYSCSEWLFFPVLPLGIHSGTGRLLFVLSWLFCLQLGFLSENR